MNFAAKLACTVPQRPFNNYFKKRKLLKRISFAKQKFNDGEREEHGRWAFNIVRRHIQISNFFSAKPSEEREVSRCHKVYFHKKKKPKRTETVIKLPHTAASSRDPSISAGSMPPLRVPSSDLPPLSIDSSAGELGRFRAEGAWSRYPESSLTNTQRRIV